MILRGMNRNALKLLACSLLCSLLGPALPANGQTPATSPSPAPVVPPLPSATRSPIDYFRELLEASPADREKLLAGRSVEHRKVLENSLRAYQALTPDERELRLRTMDLRFYLSSFLRTAPSNRADRLQLVPAKERSLVEERLKLWDQFSTEDQKELLDNERLMRLFENVGAGARPKEIPLTVQTSNQVRQIERELIRWQILPEVRRVQIQRNFIRIFQLTDAEKAREQLQPLSLSPEERRLMENTLDQFKGLSPLQRDLCIRNFRKFADLSPVERRQFLVSAQEWQKMKPEDRETWRKLVSKVPQLPPLPPRAVHTPPLPPVTPKPAQLTNR